MLSRASLLALAKSVYSIKHRNITTKCFGKIIFISLREALNLENTTLSLPLFSDWFS